MSALERWPSAPGGLARRVVLALLVGCSSTGSSPSEPAVTAAGPPVALTPDAGDAAPAPVETDAPPVPPGRELCDGGPCPPPSPTDGRKNADETDIDCGGASAPKCGLGKVCRANADCDSDACAYAHVCVAAKTCTRHFGGDTCGAGDTGNAGAAHESCCAEVEVKDRPAEAGGPFAIGRYHVTAGRMRAFLERWNGDLSAWAATAPGGWDTGWTAKLPRGWAEANVLLGPWNKRGCSVPGMGGRTFWQAAADLPSPDEASDFGQDVLDEKALNCVPWHMAMALCVAEGGRLATASELAWEFENKAFGGTLYPWGDAEPLASTQHLVWRWSYTTPVLPPNARMDAFGPLDRAYWMAPPGRRPTGASRHGVMDVAGNMLHWVGDGEKKFTWTMSWEKHGKQLIADDWETPERVDAPDGYYALGARCARSL